MPPTAARPLDGVRVLDLSRLLPGPFATLCLQGLGAEVLKVEDPAGGDYLRHTPPFVVRDGVEVGAWFWALNRGKRSVALDLRKEEGRERLLGLCAEADVLVESFRPGVMARLGLAPEVLCARFPRLVVASLTGWGQTGPMAALPGHDLGFCALAGLFADHPVAVPRMQWGDLAAGGLAAALRVAAALAGVARGGPGGWLDVAMLDGLVGLQQAQFALHAAGAPPDALLTGGLPQYGLYRCRDGWVSVGALEPAFLSALEAGTGSLDRGALEGWFAARSRHEAAERLAQACVVPVLDLDEVLQDPQIRARELFRGGLPNPPTGPVEGPPPRLGEHHAVPFRPRAPGNS